ncbi:MAG: hypothetical protein ABUL49_01075, partial [bacterium]
MRDQFGHRHRALGADRDIQELVNKLRGALMVDVSEVASLVDSVHPADIADAMKSLTDDEDAALFHSLTSHEQAEVLDEVDGPTLVRLVKLLPHERLAEVISKLPPDEAADVLGALPAEDWPSVLGHIPSPDKILDLMAYAPDTAGGLMSRNHVEVDVEGTQADALDRFREKLDGEFLFYVYAVDSHGRLVGEVDLRTLLRASARTKIKTICERDVVTVEPQMDQ